MDLKQLVEHIRGCLTEGSVQAVISALDWLQEVTRCEGIVVCQIEDGPRPTLVSLLNHSYAPEWVDLYLERRFHAVDPVLRRARAEPGLFTWGEAFVHAPDSSARDFVEAAADYGLRSGYAYSFTRRDLGKPGLRTLCSFHSRDDTLPEAAADALHALVPTFHAATTFPPVEVLPQLSAREEEVLQWSRDGKTVWEISRILAVSEATVKYHLKSLYRKLHVSNRAQAIAEAMRLGLL